MKTYLDLLSYITENAKIAIEYFHGDEVLTKEDELSNFPIGWDIESYIYNYFIQRGFDFKIDKTDAYRRVEVYENVNAIFTIQHLLREEYFKIQKHYRKDMEDYCMDFTYYERYLEFINKVKEKSNSIQYDESDSNVKNAFEKLNKDINRILGACNGAISRKEKISEEEARRLYDNKVNELRSYYNNQDKFKPEPDIVADLIKGGYKNGYGVTQEQMINHVKCLINKERCNFNFTNEEKTLCKGDEETIRALRKIADSKEYIKKEFTMPKVIAVFCSNYTITTKTAVIDYLNKKWGENYKPSAVSQAQKRLKINDKNDIKAFFKSEEISKSA